jgi:D-alanine-D-alanine ligase
MAETAYGATDNDTFVIAEMVKKGLAARGYTATMYPIKESQIEGISKIKADCIFNLIEWCGQDIVLSQKAFKYLRQLNIPVTGADEKMFVLTGDKTKVKEELKMIGAPTPRSQVFVTGEEVRSGELTYPVIVKPSLEHCSTGLSYDSIAKDKAELLPIVKRQIDTFHQPALAEEFIVGRELLVSMIEIESTVRVLPITEILFESKNPLVFQTYESKWMENHEDYNSTFYDDAELSDVELNNIEKVCVKVFKKLGLRGYSRFDLRLRSGVPYILEANANPSVYDAGYELTSIEDEIITGIKFPDYLKAIVDSAIYHFKQGDMV